MSLTLTAGFSPAPQDEATVGEASPGPSALPAAVAPGALFAPILDALVAHQNKARAHARLTASRRDRATSQMTYEWGFSPPAPILPFTP